MAKVTRATRVCRGGAWEYVDAVLGDAALVDPEWAATVRQLRAAGCVFAEDEARLLIEAARCGGVARIAALAAMVARRVAGEPVEYVLGWAEFCGLRVAVAPGVFVPRQRSGLLVRLAAQRVVPADVVIDLCCGSGALGAALAHRLAPAGSLEIHAADVDPAAVACARVNLEPFGGCVYLGDLDDPLPANLRGRVRLILANAPYVPSDAIPLLPPEAREHERLTALDGGADGLDLQRRVIACAAGWLMPGGHVVIESSDVQAEALAAEFTRSGFTADVHGDAELGATAVTGTWPGPGVPDAQANAPGTSVE